MMKKLNEYEQEMYHFLSAVGNFENMLLVMEHFEMVKRHLLEEFWEGVKSKVESELDLKSGEWRLHMNDYPNEWWTMALTKGKWPVTKAQGWDLAISWGQMNRDPYFGVWVNNNTRTLKLEAVHSEIKQLSAAINEKQEEMRFFPNDAHPWWPLLIKSDYNFAERSALKIILPEIRNDLIEQYANMFIALATVISDDLDLIIDRNRAHVA